MRIPYHHVDAFTGRVFSGNPAGVCLLDEWPEDRVLQGIAAENNLSETAFVCPGDEAFALRWFTPESEVDLCGHATLAAAHVLFARAGKGEKGPLFFDTLSGRLTVRRSGDLLEMDFPARPGREVEISAEVTRALGRRPERLFLARDLMAVFPDRASVEDLVPDMAALVRLDCLGVIVTAPDAEADCVSRFFAPRVGIAEDPVTGSAHCTLVPYWAGELGRNELHCLQVSRRGGELFCRLEGERVKIGGRTVEYLRGTITL